MLQAVIDGAEVIGRTIFPMIPRLRKLQVFPTPIWSCCVVPCEVENALDSSDTYRSAFGPIQGTVQPHGELAKLDGRRIEARGVVFATDEVFALGTQGGCLSPFVTAGRVWPSCIDLDLAQLAEDATRGDSASAALLANYREALPRIGRLRALVRKGQPGQVMATVVGDLQVVRLPADPHLARYAPGFGHLGTCPARMRIREIREIEIVTR